MNQEIDLNAFRGYGFEVYETVTCGLKLVRGHCEIHVEVVPGGVLMEIPVARLPRERKDTGPVFQYLLERNAQMKGPGFFGVRDGCIFYRTLWRSGESVAEVARELQETVERLGPKILNLLSA